LIKGIHFKTYYFIYEASLFSPGNLTFIKTLAYEKGGIRLYRNGFRVLPYGEAGNDWLGLDKSTVSRVILGPHQNISFFGFVEIEDKEGDKFEETSSREGLIENEYLDQLVKFVYRSIVSAIQKISEFRGRKATASQKNFKREEKTPAEKVDEAVIKLETFVEEEEGEKILNESTGSKERFKEVFEEFKQAREEEKEQILKEKIELIDELNMLRILAALGLVIGEFVHEVQRFLPGFDAEINFLKGIVANNNEALERVKLLDENIKAFTAYTSYFDKSISRNVIRELENIELRDVVKDFYKVIENDLKRSKITWNAEYSGYGLFTIPMHPSEWASILFNLYTNSKKAIIRSKNPGKIATKCGKDENIVYLEFSDNGDGIPKENEERIFNAFFTTTSASNHSANDAESLVGTGLGLKILKDIIESYGGEIFVSTPQEGYNTTLRIEIPQINNK
ncbi:MAG: sensor histidine kinase, partial [Chitinophagaceae bacterium]